MSAPAIRPSEGSDLLGPFKLRATWALIGFAGGILLSMYFTAKQRKKELK